MVHGLSCPMACGILADHVGSEIRLRSPELQSRFLATGPRGKSLSKFFIVYLALSYHGTLFIPVPGMCISLSHYLYLDCSLLNENP